MFSVRYKGLRIVPSYSAMQELMREGKDLLEEYSQKQGNPLGWKYLLV